MAGTASGPPWLVPRPALGVYASPTSNTGGWGWASTTDGLTLCQLRADCPVRHLGPMAHIRPPTRGPEGHKREGGLRTDPPARCQVWQCPPPSPNPRVRVARAWGATMAAPHVDVLQPAWGTGVWCMHGSQGCVTLPPRHHVGQKQADDVSVPRWRLYMTLDPLSMRARDRGPSGGCCARLAPGHKKKQCAGWTGRGRANGGGLPPPPLPHNRECTYLSVRMAGRRQGTVMYCLRQ